MSDTLVAKRYAKALFDLAVQNGTLDRTDEDVALIDATLKSSRELVSVFESPIISRPKKEGVATQLFESRVGKVTMDFVSMLIVKGREDIFPEIVSAYRSLRDTQQGIVQATVKAATALTEQDIAQLGQAIEKLTGSKANITAVVDPGLIGGVLVKVGDTVYDGSVKHQLEDLREAFQTGSSISNN